MRDQVTTTVCTSLADAGMHWLEAAWPGAQVGRVAPPAVGWAWAKAAPAGSSSARDRGAPLAPVSSRRSLALDVVGHTSALICLDMFLPLLGRPASPDDTLDGAGPSD